MPAKPKPTPTNATTTTATAKNRTPAEVLASKRRELAYAEARAKIDDAKATEIYRHREVMDDLNAQLKKIREERAVPSELSISGTSFPDSPGEEEETSSP